MDVFVEQLVEKKITPLDVLKNFLTIFLCVDLIFVLIFIGASVPFMATVSLFCCILIIWGCFKIIKNNKIEFEYSITNQDLTVDKIINKKRRKHVVSLNLKNTQEIDLYSNIKKFNKKIIKSCTSLKDSQTWFINFRHQSFGDVTLLFSPNKKLLNILSKI